ncbi:MAG: hypothetical protein RL885_24930 [Planctomycetota bacterium]
MASAQKIVALQPPGEEASNPTAQFNYPGALALEASLPPCDHPFAVRWQGEVWGAGGMNRAQLEAYVGAGATWARSNHARVGPGWEWASGAFLVRPEDPRRIQLRCRSYDAGADAKLRNCRVDAVEVRPDQGHAWTFELNTGVGVFGDRIEPGEMKAVASLDVPPLPGTGPFLLVPSVEVMPNAMEPAILGRIDHSGLNVTPTFPIYSGGVLSRYVSNAPAYQWNRDVLQAGDPITLSVTAGADFVALYRRASIFLINMACFQVT